MKRKENKKSIVAFKALIPYKLVFIERETSFYLLRLAAGGGAE